MADMDSKQRYIVALTIFLCSVCLSTALTDYERKYKRTLSGVKVNPDCSLEWCQSVAEGSIQYMHADGQDDQIHHVFSTVGAPTLMMARTTGTHTTIKVNYNKLQLNSSSDAITFVKNNDNDQSITPDHSFGIVFSKLYEYEDYNDTADFSKYQGNDSCVKMHELHNLVWQIDRKAAESGADSLEIILNATASRSANDSLFNSDNSSYISFRVRYDNADGRLETRPHMEHTSNSSIVALVLGNLQPVGSRSRTRFVAELIMFSSDHKPQTAVQHDATLLKTAKSLDDEYSPGVFKLYNWRAGSSPNDDPLKPRGYAQWKPVVYTGINRANLDLSHASTYMNTDRSLDYIVQNVLPERSLVDYFYNLTVGEVSFNYTNISFGQVNDKFYGGTNYTVWTMATGLGPVPTDDVSLVVILAISIGLGIPLILMIASSVYVCVKNRRKSREGYTAIND